MGALLIRRVFRLLLAGLAAGALIAPVSAQVEGRAYDLGKIFDAIKGVATAVEAATMSEEDEIRIGRELAAKMLGAYPALRSDELQRYLNQVGVWVALQSSRPDLPWRFAAVEGQEVNAFAVPGGTVLVTTGMLALVANEAELACVIGHEVGHIARRHHLSLLQKSALIETGSVLAQQSVREDEKSVATKYALAEGAELFTRGLDRDAERDSDADGVLYAARAGYDPSACLNFMRRLAALKREAGTLEALYRTHPQAGERVADVRAALRRLQGAEPGTGARPPLPQGDAR